MKYLKLPFSNGGYCDPIGVLELAAVKCLFDYGEEELSTFRDKPITIEERLKECKERQKEALYYGSTHMYSQYRRIYLLLRLYKWYKENGKVVFDYNPYPWRWPFKKLHNRYFEKLNPDDDTYWKLQSAHKRHIKTIFKYRGDLWT